MNLVPNYQIIDFLDWLKYSQTNRQRDIDLESYNFVELAEKYLNDSSFNYGKFDLRLVLRIFQICPQIQENGIISEMEHFTHCDDCIHYLDRRNHFGELKKLKLHPLLEEFLYFLDEKDFYFHRNDRNIGFDNEIDRDKLYSIFRRWIQDNGRNLFVQFRTFIEKIDERLIVDFNKQIRQNKEYKYTGNNESFDGELNIKRFGLGNEAHRLAESVRYLLSERESFKNPQFMQYLSIVKSESSKTIEFFNWIIRKYPQLNIASDIPYIKIEELIDQFCEERSYSDIKSFKKQVERIFKGEFDNNIFNKIRWVLGGSAKNQKNPFDRYNRMNFHGIFLFPNFGSSDLIEFIDASWQDLNSLTGEWIDIYYSKEDIKKRNGFDILKDFTSFNNIKLTDLPAFIIWDKSLNNALALPLRKLNNNQILLTIQQVVQSIKEGCDLQSVAKAGLDIINKELKRTIFFKQKIQYIMGDKFEFNNAKNFTFINKSSVVNSFNKVKEQFDEETANAIKQMAEIVEKSENADAVELFDAFNKEVNKPEPKKSLLKSFWNGLSTVLPILAHTASIAGNIIKIIG
jgi:hypothetical protein